MRGRHGGFLELPDSFRGRLLLLVITLVTLVSAPVYLYVNHVLGAQLLHDRNSTLNTLGISVASAMAENLTERERELALLADSNLLQAGPVDAADLTRHLNRLQASRPFYSWLSFTGLDGRVVAASGNLLLGVDVHARPWFSSGLQAPYIGNVHSAVLLGKLLPPEPDHGPIRFVDVAVPVHRADGQLIGVLAAHLNWRWAGETIHQLIPAATAESGTAVLVVDRQGQVLYPAALFGTHVNPDGSEPPSARTLRGNTLRIDAPQARQAHFLTASVPMTEVLDNHPLGWRVLVRQPIHITLAEATTLQRLVLISVLLAGLLFLLAAWWTVGQISRPLERLVSYAGGVTLGAAAEPLDLQSGAAEIRQLTHAIHDMAVSLLRREQTLQQTNQQLEAEVQARTLGLERANAALEQLVARDHLTGLHNRRAASERLHLEFVRLQRHKTPYVLLLLDIDLFKQVNDQFGHATGDAVLCQLAEMLRHTLRESDFIARFGGEEFLVLLPDTWEPQGFLVAEKLRAAVAAAAFPAAGGISISLGLAVAHAHDTSEDCAVMLADRGLYAAKAAGRNCVRAVARSPHAPEVTAA